MSDKSIGVSSNVVPASEVQADTVTSSANATSVNEETDVQEIGIEDHASDSLVLGSASLIFEI